MIKCNDLFLGGAKKFRLLLQKAERIYVLSEKGLQALRNKYSLTELHRIPHIVPNPVQPRSRPLYPDIMYVGFIGKNKGLEYALEVHAHFLKLHPNAKFKIAGTAIGKSAAYLESLTMRAYRNVQFLGYVPELEMDEICYQSAFAFQPFKPYRGYVPVSGSILYCQEKGTVVLTTPVNAIPEIISDWKNGVLLSGNPKKDAENMHMLWTDQARYEEIRYAAYLNLLKYHAPEKVASKMID
jgi:glycosyltransferase involved in cell wall biosynthesis